jgi:hypothetical protein
MPRWYWQYHGTAKMVLARSIPDLQVAEILHLFNRKLDIIWNCAYSSVKADAVPDLALSCLFSDNLNQLNLYIWHISYVVHPP